MEGFRPLMCASRDCITGAAARRTCGTENSALAAAAASELNCYSRKARGEERQTLAKMSKMSRCCENKVNRRNHHCILLVLYVFGIKITQSRYLIPSKPTRRLKREACAPACVATISLSDADGGWDSCYLEVW